MNSLTVALYLCYTNHWPLLRLQTILVGKETPLVLVGHLFPCQQHRQKPSVELMGLSQSFQISRTSSIPPQITSHGALHSSHYVSLLEHDFYWP